MIADWHTGDAIGLDNTSITQRIMADFWAADSARRNDILRESLEMALHRKPGGLPRLDIYKFINRMSKKESAPDGDTIFFDGKPLLWMGVTSFEGDGMQGTGTFKYKHLWTEQ